MSCNSAAPGGLSGLAGFFECRSFFFFGGAVVAIPLASASRAGQGSFLVRIMSR